MKFTLVGGDVRSVCLGRLLEEDGNEVKYFALEALCRSESSLEDAICTAQCVISGIPSVKGGLLNAPAGETSVKFDTLAAMLTPAQTLCGWFGNCDVKTKGRIIDLAGNAVFAEGNAALTAEAATALLIESSDGAVYGSSLLILGGGRVSGALVQRLRGFEAHLTVGTRSAAGTVSIDKALSAIERFDFIINTVPARIIPADALKGAKKGAVIMELASTPGGFDTGEAEKAGLKVIPAPALPARFSPLASAKLIRKAIYREMRN